MTPSPLDGVFGWTPVASVASVASVALVPSVALVALILLVPLGATFELHLTGSASSLNANSLQLRVQTLNFRANKSKKNKPTLTGSLVDSRVRSLKKRFARGAVWGSLASDLEQLNHFCRNHSEALC